MKYKSIISDLDGVLVDTKDIHYRALNRALSEIVNYVIPYHEHLKTFDGLPTLKKLSILESRDWITEFDKEKIVKLKNYYTDIELSLIKENPKLIELFKFLSDNFEYVLVASNAIKKTVDTCLEKLGIDHLTDRAYNNEEVKKAKPNPEIYLRAMADFSINPKECLIIEDSVHGREAAISSGATLIPVNSPQDLTIEKIKKYMSESNETYNKWEDDQLNIVIPMEGNGSRFSEVGYTFPKPLIDVAGKPMIQRVVESLQIKANYIYIVRKEHYDKYALESMLNLITPGCKIIQLDEVTDGAARTVLLAEQYINNDSPLIICNSDQIIKWDAALSMYKFMNSSNDGIILTFDNLHAKWSYAKVENDFVTQVAEKNPISNHATCLHYDTPVLMADGSTKLIGKLVNSKSEELVMSFNIVTKKYEPKKIIGWVKKKGNANWFNLTFKDNRFSSGEKIRSINITGDHKVFTKRGYVQVSDLEKSDEIMTSYLSPNEKQMEFIDGTLLGDGMYKRPNKKGELGRLVVKQSTAQIEWFNIKKNILKVFGGNQFIEEPYSNKILGRKIKSTGSYRWSVSSNPAWSAERERWYSDKKKIVPKNLKLTPLMIATWYMDDGSLGSNQERLVLCTDSFEYTEVSFLREQLRDFGINSKVWKRGSGFRIVISNNGNKDFSAFNFFSLISKYIIPSMQYKLPEHFRGEFEESIWEMGKTDEFYSEVKVVKIDKENMHSKFICKPHEYCLEIEDNHNFFAGNMLVSNCGIYGYKKGSDFVKSAYSMIKKDIRVNNEFYVAPTINELIQEGQKFIVQDVEEMYGVGTPEDLQYYLTKI